MLPKKLNKAIKFAPFGRRTRNKLLAFYGVVKFNSGLIMSKNLGILLGLSLVLSAIVGSLFLGIRVSSPAGIGWVVGYSLGLILISIILCGIPAGIYWLLKRKKMPGFAISIWIVWGLVFVMATLGNML